MIWIFCLVVSGLVDSARRVFLVSACFHIHILPHPTCNHAGRVKKNGTATPKSQRKTRRTPNRAQKPNHLVETYKPPHPHKEQKRPTIKEKEREKSRAAQAILGVCRRRGNGCSHL